MSAEECHKAALARVYRSLSACEQSSKKLRSKMESEGYPADSIDYALNRAIEVRVLDDLRYCNMLVRNSLVSGKGMQRCLKEIEELDLDPMEVEEYVDYINQDPDSEVDRALDYLRSHKPRAKDIRAAAFRKLITRGFSYDVSSKASRIYLENLNDED